MTTETDTDNGVDVAVDVDVDVDVAIVGHGPVGASLAILLAQRGHRVVVLERQPAPYPLPRAVHFDHEVGRIFQACGIGEVLRAVTEPAEVYEWRNGDGVVLLRYGRRGASASGWPESSMFNQPALEAILADRVAALPNVEVRRGVEVEHLEQDDHGVVLRAVDGSSVRARFAIGCDGARSTLRTLLARPVCDLGFFYDWLIVDVVLHEPRTFDPVNVQICDPGRPTTAVSGGPGRRRWEFMRLPHEHLDELDQEARAWELLADWDISAANATLERHAVYAFSARYAERWRTGRVFLAGDAAHQMPPFAGQGMCAGIRDAMNLSWKLDLVLRGRAPADLLDTYEAERRPDAHGAIAFSIELGKVICVPDREQAARRDALMAPAVGPEPSEVPERPRLADGLLHPTAAHAGALFVQGEVGGRPFDDVHGAGWRVVTVDGSPLALDPADAEWFTDLGGRVVAVDGADPVYARWFAEHDAVCVLQRPDFHLYGTASSAAAGADLVRDLRRHLAADLEGARS